MGCASTGARRGLRKCIVVVSALVAAFVFTTNNADARHHRRGHVHFARQTRHGAPAGGGYAPPTASIVVDGNTGAVLEESNPDALRHPASLTKVMTLYLLFEQLDAGKIRLDTPLTVSAHAAAQAPTKLGLKPGQTISVQDAIKGIVTRSANDAAVVIAENLGGSEEAFCRSMTQKARALGMSRTTYVNASGLPDDGQITTARDQALLGRAIEDRFPRYYRYFSTTSYVFRGRTIRGHNHLLGAVPGVDGIKTGFTEASGFNLLTSLHRDGRYLVAVVLGGRSAGERDAHMRALINANVMLAAARRTAPTLAERAEPYGGRKSNALAKAAAQNFARQSESVAAESGAAVPRGPRAVVGSSDPIRPVIVKTVSYHTVTVRSPSMKPMPVLVPVGEPAPRKGTQAMAQIEPPEAPAQTRGALVASAGPLPAINAVSSEIKPSAVRVAEAEPEAKPLPQASPHLHSGWVIQIGAFGGADEAREHLTAAREKLQGVLAKADPFTESVQKGDTVLYRARFAGFDKVTAEAACRALKHSDVPCMVLKD